jgi:hypothetical protein
LRNLVVNSEILGEFGRWNFVHKHFLMRILPKIRILISWKFDALAFVMGLAG